MEIETARCRLRAPTIDDADDVVRHLNDRAVWRNLSDIVPHPYTLEHAREWLTRCQAERPPPRTFAIEVDGRLCGAIGLHRLEREKSHTAVVGYWLGRAHWGRGIATAALAGFVDYVFASFPVDRLQSSVYAWNPASSRVLEKNGFALEGRLRNGVFKDGEHGDELIYGRLR